MKKQSDSGKGLAGVIVAIDGPSGAGKSTVSRLLAKELDGFLLDTGGMYRGVAYHALLKGLKTAREFGALAREMEFDVDSQGQLTVNGELLGDKLRTEGVSQMASAISQHASVRRVLTQRQRELAEALCARKPVVVEGRDIGTVVFPKVPFKFFVTADSKVRAKRRHEQLRGQGVRTTLKEVLTQIEKRDRQDSSRKLAPLKCAKDAVVVDTSSMDIGQVVQFMADHIRGLRALSDA